ncbi:MAG: nucleotidyltransferase domain-containing protein [Actinobacteria bacterium]|nr:nucleotidyltransferase domain-containing protein [Actinomycetota bacterium]
MLSFGGKELIQRESNGVTMFEVPEFFNGLKNAQVWLVGSHLYGLNTEDSDMDFGAVFFDPAKHVDPFYNDNVTNTNDTNDFYAHDLAKYARLLRKGNPNLVDLVFVEPVQKSRVVSDFLAAVRELVVHQGLLKSYFGYAQNQGKRGFLYRTRENPDRLAQVTELGYDPKYVSHLLRLCFQGRKMLEHGTYPAMSYYPETQQFLREVKSGDLPLEHAEQIVELNVGMFEDAMKSHLHKLQTHEAYENTAREFFVSYFS